MDDFEFKIHIMDKDYRAYVETIKEKFKNPQKAREWCNNKDGRGYDYVVDKESIEKFNALKEKK